MNSTGDDSPVPDRASPGSDPALSRAVWITGAAGGLGLALIDAFVNAGWRVAGSFHSHPPPNDSRANLWVRADLALPHQAAEAAAQIIRRFGHVDAMVLNAGATADLPLWQLTEASWDDVIAANLTSAFHSIRALLPEMVRRREGHIIGISSWAARSGSKGQSNYAAAKAGLIALLQSVAREQGAANIRANAVLPGVLPTAMTARLEEGQRRALITANALERINSLEEVARFVAFLASMRNVSGQVFQLDSRIGPWS